MFVVIVRDIVPYQMSPYMQVHMRAVDEVHISIRHPSAKRIGGCFSFTSKRWLEFLDGQAQRYGKRMRLEMPA
jgi:hypothetical protein